MNDDVADLLVKTSSSRQENPLLSLIPSKLVLASPHITFDQFKHEIINSSRLLADATNNENDDESNFSFRIRSLEQQAKELLLTPVKLPRDPDFVSNQYQLQQQQNQQFFNNPHTYNNPKQIKRSTSYSNNHTNSQNNESMYFKQMRQKVDNQFKETENMKSDLNKSKQMVYEPLQDNSHSNNRDNSSSWVDNVIDLRMQLKESQRFNEELKSSFKQNINQLKASFQECLDDKEKVIFQK
jgi:hypothetical protein